MSLFPPLVTAYSSRVRSPRLRAEASTRTPSGFLVWLMAAQAPLIAAGAAVGAVSFLPGVLGPWIVGRAIDSGVVHGDTRAAFWWAGLLLATVAVSVVAQIGEHTANVSGWLVAMYRTMLLVARKAAQLGHVLPRRTPIGESLSVASADSNTFGALSDVLPRAFAAMAAFVGMAWIVMNESWLLGLVTIVTTPLIVACGAPLLRPLERSQALERSRSSELTGMATDIVGGLRILRGVGGEHTFGDNYAAQSQSTRAAGVRAGAWMACVEGLGVLLSGLQLVLLTWLGAHELLAGRLSVGQLVSFFGYALFLTWPIQTLFELASKWVQALVAADRTIALLRHEPPWPPDADSARLPLGAPIHDLATGFTAEPGQFTAVVCSLPDESAALADRLGRYLPTASAVSEGEAEGELSGKARREYRARRDAAARRVAEEDEALASAPWGVEVGGVDLTDVRLSEVRRHILVSDAAAEVFAGTLQEAVDPFGTHDRMSAEAALRAASAEDVYDALPQGWQGELEERGRGLSGGQRQRLVLARALLMNPEILVLVEPTSAVDAHTEARIAERLRDYRDGRTTIVTTASPLVLRQADAVALLRDGRIVARGTHRELLETCNEYRSVVERGAELAGAGSGVGNAGESVTGTTGGVL